MLIVKTIIEIQQIPVFVNDVSDYRDNIIYITNPIDFRVENNNMNLIQTAEVTISRKMKKYVYAYTNFSVNNIPYNALNGKKLIAEADKKSAIFGFSKLGDAIPPLIKYGDMIRIYAGYVYVCENGIKHDSIVDGNKQTIDGVEYYNDDVVEGNDIFKRSLLFTGYITEITTSTHTVLKCQDYMAFFNQLLVPDFTFSASNNKKLTVTAGNLLQKKGTQETKAGTLSGMLSLMLLTNDKKQGGFSIDNYFDNYDEMKLKPIFVKPSAKDTLNIFDVKLADTTRDDRFSDVKTEHSTVGDFIKHLSDSGWCHSFFYPNTSILNISIFRYNENKYSSTNETGYQSFTFEFQKNIIHNNLIYKKKDNQAVGAIVKATFSVNNGKDNVTPQIFIGTPGGKMFTFLYGRRDHFGEIDLTKISEKEEKKIEEDMRNWGKEKLLNFYYEGYYGSFVTFGFPYIRFGDHVTIIDNQLRERDGTYKVKAVVYSGGSKKGLRQEIFLDRKVGDNNPLFSK